jgi:hypothetical protein
MAFFFYGSIVNEPVEMPMLVAVFLTVFLFFFFCFNMRQAPADKLDALAGVDEEEPVIQDYVPELASINNLENGHDYEELEELEAVEPKVGSDILDQKTALVNPPQVSNIRLAFGDDDIPYLVESSGLELVDEDLGAIVRFIHGAEPTEPEELLDAISAEEAELEELSEAEFVEETASNDGVEAAELENISTSFGSIAIFRQPFAYSLSNPELLYGAASQVIYEQNGIHFINTHFDGEGTDKILDSNFAKLVESVLTPSAARN